MIGETVNASQESEGREAPRKTTRRLGCSALASTTAVAILIGGCASANGAPSGWDNNKPAQVIAVACTESYPDGECEAYAGDYAQCPEDQLYLYLSPDRKKGCIIWQVPGLPLDPPPQIENPGDPGYPS
jgi:hypothetical protein